MAPGGAVRWNINKYETDRSKVWSIGADREATRIVDRDGGEGGRGSMFPTVLWTGGEGAWSIRQRFVDQLRLIARTTQTNSMEFRRRFGFAFVPLPFKRAIC